MMDFEKGLRKESSVIIPYLQEIEKQFLDLVNNGNILDVKDFLDANPTFNINVADFQGVTGLHIAVNTRNLPMVEYLLSLPDIDPGDTHLHAIRNNEEKIAVTILNKLNDLAPGLEYVGVTQSSDFPDDTTPLQVAAQWGHFEMINLLRRRQHFLQKPHPPYCNCHAVCMDERKRLDPLTIEKLRLFAYKAITNPAYICQTSDDPILEAFNLAHELKKAAIFDREFYFEYKELSENVAQFATDLIGCARNVDEVEEVLKQSTGYAQSSKFVYPRLLFALHIKQKTFVAHPNVQQLIANKWIDGWYEWKLKSMPTKFLIVLRRIVELLFIPIVVMLAPNSRLSKFWQSPVNKFISSTASYLVFLIIVFLQSNMDKKDQLRGPPDTVYVWILTLYVISYIWAAIRLCIIHGPERFFTSRWYCFDIIMISLFVMTFAYWITAAIDVKINGQLQLERKYWNQFDPTLIAEGLFCLATVMAFLKLLHIFQLDYSLGPLQLSLGKMFKDVGHFIALFSIIILAFTAGTCKLYQYYEDMVQEEDESKIKTQQVSSFVNFGATLKTLFWALFCMSPIESADVIIENLPGESETETVINYHMFTEFIGYFTFAGFTFISVILILNMLIACMSNTFTKVTENVIVEWTFGRTEAYVDYMLTTTLPPPFNIIPTYIGIQPTLEYIKILLRPPANKRARWDFQHCCFIKPLEKESSNKFDMVMSQLVQRYFRKKVKEEVQSEVERLTNEIIELRSLLREALTTD